MQNLDNDSTVRIKAPLIQVESKGRTEVFHFKCDTTEVAEIYIYIFFITGDTWSNARNVTVTKLSC